MTVALGVMLVSLLQASASVAPASAGFELHIAEYQPAAGLTEATLDSGEKIYVGRTLATSSDVVNARVGREGDRFSIIIELTPIAAMNLLAATVAHAGRPLAIVVDGEVISAPRLHTPVANRIRIDGTFTKEEAEGVVGELNKHILRKERDQ